MRKHLVAAVAGTLALLASSTATAQAGIWTPVASGTTQDITAVDYRAPDQLYYATSNGQIFKNGTLMAGSPGIGHTFTGIEFNPSGTIGLASANNGELYRFNGVTWSLVSLANTTFNHLCPGSGAFARNTAPAGNLNAVAWKDDLTAYVPGADRGVVLKTTNGGTSWLDVSRQANGTCFADPGSADTISDVAAVQGTDLVYLIGTSFGQRLFSSNGLTSSAQARNNTSVNCFSIPMHIAIDPNNPNRNIVVGSCNGSLSLGFSQDGGTNYQLGQTLPNGSSSDLTGLNDIAMAGGSWLMAGNGGSILVDSDGQNAYFQRADGVDATNDWLAVDKFDATNGAVGGRNGRLVISGQANAIPDLIAPAGTITGPTTVTAGQAATFTANVADNAGGSGINPASFAWSATGIPGATGNPASITFPSAGFYTLKVTFADNAGNAGSATISVTVRAGSGTTVIPPGTANPLPRRTVTVAGGQVTLSGPKTCVGVGKRFTATLSFKKATRKGAKFVKVTRVDFYIDGKRVKIDKKAPFKQRLSVKSYSANSKHTLKARAYIKVRRGKAPKKSISTSFQVCSS